MAEHTEARPFSNGSEYELWCARNCDHCALNTYRPDDLTSPSCAFEEALSLGTITGTVDVALAVEYGATLSEDAGYIDMPPRCARFAA